MSLPERPGTWAVLTAAPHRLMFFGGALQLLFTLLYWGAELAGRHTGLWLPPATTVPALWAHVALMLYGLYPFFFLGFLMTTYPRWMNGPEVPRQRYLTAFLLLAGGTLLFYLGLFAAKVLMMVAVGLWLAGLAAGLTALWRVYRAAPATSDRFYERWLNAAFVAGWVGLACYGLWLVQGSPLTLRASMEMGLWMFLTPVLVTVSHRMIPFFSGCVLPDYREVKPRWSLWLLNGGLALHGLLAILELRGWLFVADLPVAALALWHTRDWRFRASFRVGLLAVLHVAFLTFGVAMLLYGLQSLALTLTGQLWLARAPLHLLGIGFITAMLIAMATRVSLGHSGRPLTLDAYGWACFLGICLAALLRVRGEWPPLAERLPLHPNLLAALVWLTATAAWLARFLPIYLRPRADGRPG